MISYRGALFFSYISSERLVLIEVHTLEFYSYEFEALSRYLPMVTVASFTNSCSMSTDSL